MVLGLGYVGLPLALELSNILKFHGFDTNKKRIHELNKNIDQPMKLQKNKFSRKKYSLPNKLFRL